MAIRTAGAFVRAAHRIKFCCKSNNYATSAGSAAVGLGNSGIDLQAEPSISAISTFVPPQLTLADTQKLSTLRNIGICAHIDSGKTTLTERILFYTGRIRAIHEVRGRDAVGAKMDSMDLEREKGITIQSAATFCDWTHSTTNSAYNINIIDTPGHVDFTIEVERALRVLDGAVLVLCAVSGVQSQTITVDRQMKRYNVPRLAVVNKMDRPGANPARVCDQMKAKLRLNAALVQYPIGTEGDFCGVVDLVHWRTIINSGEKGTVVTFSDEIPAEILDSAKAKRQQLIESLCDADDEIADVYLAEQREITNDDIHQAIRRSVISQSFVPVFIASAYKNTGVQALLDGVADYLPSPADVKTQAVDIAASDAPVQLVPAQVGQFVGLAFKLEEGKFGQLTYMRVYQGTLRRGGFIVNTRTGKRVKVPRLVRMHSDEMEDVPAVTAGEICAMFGVECSSGDTFNDANNNSESTISMSSMFVPEPVLSLALRPTGLETPAFSKALNRFKKEDPTFRMQIDHESGETIISGMGELHLEIYVERMKREYGVTCKTGKPRVAFRETVTQPVSFSYVHKKQTGGAGQFAKIEGVIEPILPEDESTADFEFSSQVVGGNIPSGYIPAIEKGFKDALERGMLIGHPIKGLRVTVTDGAYHAVDSSELAFRICAHNCLREHYAKTKPVVLEPIMAVDIVAPSEFQGVVVGGINQRKGMIIDNETRDDEFTLSAEVSLNEMFGYSSQLRGMTQGKGEFSMEYKRHQPVLPNVQVDMVEAYRKSIGWVEKKD